MPNSGPNTITNKKILAVEGIDEKNFFDKLLKYWGISDFQIEDIGGKDKFPKRFPALLKTTGFSPRMRLLLLLILLLFGIRTRTKHSQAFQI